MDDDLAEELIELALLEVALRAHAGIEHNLDPTLPLPELMVAHVLKHGLPLTNPSWN